MDRAKGYGIEGISADGNDAVALHLLVRKLVADLRRKPRAVLLECDTMRMRGHGEHDDFSYVPRELIDQYAKRDPIKICWEQVVAAKIATREELDQLEHACREEVNTAYHQALSEPPPDPSTLMEGVYAGE